jgi:hypothetical protein
MSVNHSNHLTGFVRAEVLLTTKTIIAQSANAKARKTAKVEMALGASGTIVPSLNFAGLTGKTRTPCSK